MVEKTTFSEEALERYLIMFGVGDLASCKPLDQGTRNSNYELVTTQYDEDQRWILTIVEELGFDDVPFVQRIMSHIAAFGLPAPPLRATLDGMIMTIFSGKPALLAPRLPGAAVSQPSAEHCETIGKTIADMQGLIATKGLTKQSPFDSSWASQMIDEFGSNLSTEQRQRYHAINTLHSDIEVLELPRGTIHGEMIRDNTLFSDGNLTGILDFYQAADDFLIMDLAIAMIDWCRTEDQQIDPGRYNAMLNGYEQIRKLEENERELLPVMQSIACARLLYSRLQHENIADQATRHDALEFHALARWLSTA